MKYYAVNNNSRSLAHHGIKGMKWGVLRTDAQLGHPKSPSKPRSSAYQKAKQKLSEGMKRGIDKAKDSWREYNSPENKEYRAYKKSEKTYQKHLQQARKGKLKYKNVKSDDELYRITERLNSERASRALSNAEQGFISRFRKSVGEGLVQGAGKGASAYVEARFKGRGETTAAIKKEKRMAAYHNSISGRVAQSRENRYQKRLDKQQDKRDAKSEARKEKRDLKKEYRNMVQEDGADYRIHGISNATRRKRIAQMKDKRQALEDTRKVENAYRMALATKNADRESLREHNRLEDERKFRMQDREYMRGRVRQRYEQAEHDSDVREGRVQPMNDREERLRADYVAERQAEEIARKRQQQAQDQAEYDRQRQESARLTQEAEQRRLRNERDQRVLDDIVRRHQEEQRRLQAQQEAQERQRRIEEQRRRQQAADEAAANWRRRQDHTPGSDRRADEAAANWRDRQRERERQGRLDRLDPELERQRARDAMRNSDRLPPRMRRQPTPQPRPQSNPTPRRGFGDYGNEGRSGGPDYSRLRNDLNERARRQPTPQPRPQSNPTPRRGFGDYGNEGRSGGPDYSRLRNDLNERARRIDQAGSDIDDLTRRMLDRQNTSERRKKRSRR